MTIAIVDYSAGNLHSIRGAFQSLGEDAEVVDRPEGISGARLLVLPGVGAFGEAMATLEARGWAQAIRRAALDDGKAVLGVCLGMQLLTQSSEEFGFTQGLGLLGGRVQSLRDFGVRDRVPHMGWNALSIARPDHPVIAGIDDGEDVYFVHSFAVDASAPDEVVASTDYGARFPAIIAKNRIVGMQFHPEKSSAPGLRLLRNVLEHVAC